MKELHFSAGQIEAEREEENLAKSQSELRAKLGVVLQSRFLYYLIS